MDIATLGVEIRSDSVEEATLKLRAFPEAASAAERAADKLKITTTAAGATSEEFSRRVLRSIDTLKFQADQLSRSSAEQERFTALRRAGVTAESAAGQAISATVTALQAQRAAQLSAADASRQAQQQAVSNAAAAKLVEENNRRAAAAVQSVVSALDFEMAQLGRNALQRAQYNAVRQAGIATDTAEARAIMVKVAALDAERRALAGGGGLLPHQRVNLGYQMNDIFTQLASGASPLMVAAQQGPQITQIFGGIGATLAAIPKTLLVGGAAALGVGALVAAVAALKEANDALETQKRRLGDVIGDQRLAADAYGEIRRQASAAGEEIEKTAAKYEKFTRAGVFVGATGGQVGGLMSVVSQVGRLGGATADEQTSTVDALAKALSESVVSASNLDGILQNMPGLGRRIAEGLGLSVVQLRLMAQQGDLTNKQVFDSLLSQQDRVAAKFKETGITVGGFLSDVLRSIGDVAVGLYKVAANIELVNSKAEAARRAQAANANRPTRAAPRVIGANGSQLSFEEMVASGEIGQTDSTLLNNPARLTTQFLDLQRAATAAAGEAVLAADKIAERLLSDTREVQQQIDAVTKGLDALQGGFTGLDSTKAAAETKRLTDALQFLRDRSLEAKDAYGQAIDAAQTRQLQNEIGMTPGQRATQARVGQLASSRPGVTTEAAQSVVSAEQLQALDDMIAKQQLELATQTAITQAMRSGKAAADDAAVAMQVLGIAFEQLGAITPEVQVKLDILAQTLSDIREQARAQSSIDASKPLITELEGIAAAMKVVEQGAFAMKRAQAEAKAARDENGTGGLQMQVFDAQQALADATAIKNLNDQIKLTNDLAAAAGNVAEQKRIQLDYDIKQAQLAAGPGAAALLAEKMKADFTAKTNLEMRNGTASMERSIDLAQQQLGIIRSGAPDQAAQIAMLAKRNELLDKGIDLQSEDAQKQITLAGQKARIDEQLGYEKDAADATKRTWMKAYDNIQSAGADAFYGIFTGAGLNGQSAAETIKNIFLRTFAEIAAAAVIRPIITPIFQAAAGIGLIPGGVVPAATGSTASVGSGGLGGLASMLPSGGMSSLASNFLGGGGSIFSNLGSNLAGMGSRALSFFGMGSSAAASYPNVGALIASGNTGASVAAGGGLSAAASAIPVWGWITAAATIAKQFTQGKPSNSPLGAVNTLLGPSVDEWMQNPLRSAYQVFNPLGPVGAALGQLVGFDPFGDNGPKIPPQPDYVYSRGAFYGNGAGGWVSTGGYEGSGSNLSPQGAAMGDSVTALMKAGGLSYVNGKVWGGELVSATDHTLNGQQWQDRPFTSTHLLAPGMGAGGAELIGAAMDYGRSPEQAQDFLTSQVFRTNILRGGFSGVSSALRQGIEQINPQTVADTQSIISSAAAYDKLGKALNPVKDAVDKISASFDDLTDFATKAGLSLQPITDEMAKQTKRTAQDFVDNMLDPLAVQLRALADERDAAITSAQYIRDNVKDVYVDMDRISTFYTNKEAQLREQFYQGGISNLEALIQRLTYGDLANASPTLTLSGVQASYDANLAQARAGGVSAISNYSTLAEQFAQAGRANFASGPQYEAIRQQILRDADVVQAIATGGTTTVSANTSQELSQAAQTQNAQISQLRELVQILADKVDKQSNDNAALVAQLRSRTANGK